MTIFGRVVKWLRGRPVWAGNRYDPGDNAKLYEKVTTRSGQYLFLLFYIRGIGCH